MIKINRMIENGTYMSASEAFFVDTQERNRVANQIFFFLRDGMDEAEYPFPFALLNASK